jgi:hypothetical protein
VSLPSCWERAAKVCDNKKLGWRLQKSNESKGLDMSQSFFKSTKVKKNLETILIAAVGHKSNWRRRFSKEKKLKIFDFYFQISYCGWSFEQERKKEIFG